MCFGGSLPNSLGYLIASLEVGDEVIIHEDKEDITTYIWNKDGFAALTASGHILTCKGNVYFEVTGNYLDEFEVSEEAKAIQAQIDALPEDWDPWQDDNDPLDLL